MNHATMALARDRLAQIIIMIRNPNTNPCRIKICDAALWARLHADQVLFQHLAIFYEWWCVDVHLQLLS